MVTNGKDTEVVQKTPKVAFLAQTSYLEFLPFPFLSHLLIWSFFELSDFLLTFLVIVLVWPVASIFFLII